MNTRRGPVAIFLLTLVGSIAACASLLTRDAGTTASVRFRNAYLLEDDTGERVAPTYFLRRAWVQITRDRGKTEVPPTVSLSLQDLATRSFAVAWLGHSAMLVRAGSSWILIDPVLSDTAGPVAGFGPARLTPLPIAPEALPHIDLVLISHDHYDHLDLGTMQRLARQAGGVPRFLVGRGLGAWFARNVRVQVQEFDWWQSATVGDQTLTFVPAQHSSGRGVWRRNATLWGGWVIEHAARRFYFSGDTAYVPSLFQDIRARLGAIHLAAIPIGAYQPRELMRYEHLDPDEAVLAHLDIGALRSFGVHWGTFQLGDEEPFQPARDLAASLRRRGVETFGLLAIGTVLDVAHEPGARITPLIRAAELTAAFAGP